MCIISIKKRDNVVKILETFKGKKILGFSGRTGDDDFKLLLEDDCEILFYHSQDCCEEVFLEDIVGDPASLIGKVLNCIEVKTDEDYEAPVDYNPESYTWTFFTIKAGNRYLDLRFFGSSNGYYSESADIKYIDKNNPNNSINLYVKDDEY
jgi:hypothetical protein